MGQRRLPTMTRLKKWWNDPALRRTLKISLPIWAIIILPGILMSLHDWWTSRAQISEPATLATDSAPVSPAQPEAPSAPAAPATPVAETPAAAAPPPVAPPQPAPVVAAVPPPQPVPAVAPAPPAPAPVAVVAPAPVAPPPVAPPAPTVPTIVYQDNFGRQGELDGSSPDAKNTNGAKWTVSGGPGAYATKGGSVSDNNVGYDAAYLPVNGTSGVTLDGKQNFTLSATVRPEAAGYWMGISLNTAPITNGHNMADNGLVEMALGKGYADAYDRGANLNHVENDYLTGAPYVISMTYHATKGAITYTVGDKVIATLSGVKAEEIAALTDVSIGNGHSGPTAAISNFTLTVGGLD